MSQFDSSLLHDFDAASHYEWIETDAGGGVAASSILGAHTRKQHGLFSINDDHGGRVILLSNLQETVEDGTEAFDLSTIVFSGAVDPAGYRYLVSFTDSPWPTWRFAFDGFELEKQFFLVHEEHHTAVVSYSLTKGDRPVTLAVRPFLAFRDQDSVRRETFGLPANWHVNDEFAECQPYPGGPTLFIAHPFADRHTVPLWYRDFLFTRDQESGLDCMEDLFHPGVFRFKLGPRQHRALVFSSPSPRSVSMVPRYMEMERKRRSERRHVTNAPRDSFFQSLLAAADAFVFERHDGAPAIYEGLPWSRETMRSTLMALPGLLLVSGRFEQSERYFMCLATQLDDPERLQERQKKSGEPLLWLFVAAWRHWKATGPSPFTQDTLVPLLEMVADAYEATAMDGLVPEPVSLMKPETWFLLPTNALWYNAQMALADLLAERNGKRAGHWRKRAEATRRSLNDRFQCHTRKGLAHGVRETQTGNDERVWASQILAAGLPFAAAEQVGEVIEVVQDHLLTPYGLRSLSRHDPHYSGDGRDVALLPREWSGSVDPAWFGCYCDALVNAGLPLDTDECFAPWSAELTSRGLGHISGAFAGEWPHTPLDYVASACGVAEVLRIYAREVLHLSHVV